MMQTKKVNVFAMKSEETENRSEFEDSKETDHDIFGSNELPDGMMYIRTADGRRISVPKKYYPKSKQRQRKLVLDRQEQYKWHNFPIHI